jgi:hypothetical protein
LLTFVTYVFWRLLQLVAVSDVAAHGTSRVAELESALAQAKKAAGESGSLRDKIKVSVVALHPAAIILICVQHAA